MIIYLIFGAAFAVGIQFLDEIDWVDELLLRILVLVAYPLFLAAELLGWSIVSAERWQIVAYIIVSILILIGVSCKV